MLLSGLYLVPWLLLLRWGGVAATFWIALPADTALLDIRAKAGGTAFAADWAAGLTAPITEEFAKALGLVLLIGLAPRLVRSAYDGFVIGAFIGLGFQVFEDVLHVVNGATQSFGVDQFGSSLHVFLLRDVPRGVLTMLTAMVFHFAWDDMAGLSGGGALFFLVLPLVVVVEPATLFHVLRHAAGRERAWVGDLLGPEVATGAVDPPLLDAVSGLRKQREAYREHLRSRRRARHLIEGAQDLAHEIAAQAARRHPRSPTPGPNSSVSAPPLTRGTRPVRPDSGTVSARLPLIPVPPRRRSRELKEFALL